MTKIFHFINAPLTIDQLRFSGRGMNTSGGWLAALVGLMLKKTDFRIICASFGNTRHLQVFRDERIDCYIIPGAWDDCGSSMERSLRICKDLIDETNPDLVHIHGTESAYGLLTARSMIKKPTLISLQGLLGPCAQWYRFFGNNSLKNIIRMHRLLEIPAMRGLWIGYWRFQKMAQRECEIIKGNRSFMGRTQWDHSYITSLNPSADYYYGGELLRDAFWSGRWDIRRANRHRIIFTNAGHPRKGTELLIEAVKLLQPLYPDIQIAIAGTISRRSGYGRYIRRRINELGQAATELGQLNAEEMAGELLRSHVFVSPSYIDNSSNAVCEAQLLGMPVISTYTGGIPSLIEDGRTGLFVPTGDPPMLAARLREVFENDNLAGRLGSQAHEVADRRHDPDEIFPEILTAYEQVFRKTTRQTNHPNLF